MNTNLAPAKTALPAVPLDETARLSPTQITVLDALLSGKTATDAAAAAGVSRSALYKWLRQDYAFQAALNRGRRDCQQAVACRIEQITADAAECVAGAVRNGDVKTALEILKQTGALAPAKIGSDDELTLQIQEQLKNEQRDMGIAMADIARNLGKDLGRELGHDKQQSNMNRMPRPK
jgi:transposase-like protein